MAIKGTAENKIMFGLGGLIALAIAVSTIGAGWDRIDAAVLTESEAMAIHATYDAKLKTMTEGIEKQSALNECRWLSDKIERLEWDIYALRRDGADSDFIRTKESTRDKHERRYDALNCARILR